MEYNVGVLSAKPEGPKVVDWFLGRACPSPPAGGLASAVSSSSKVRGCSPINWRKF